MNWIICDAVVTSAQPRQNIHKGMNHYTPWSSTLASTPKSLPSFHGRDFMRLWARLRAICEWGLGFTYFVGNVPARHWALNWEIVFCIWVSLRCARFVRVKFNAERDPSLGVVSNNSVLGLLFRPNRIRFLLCLNTERCKSAGSWYGESASFDGGSMEQQLPTETVGTSWKLPKCETLTQARKSFEFISTRLCCTQEPEKRMSPLSFRK